MKKFIPAVFVVIAALLALFFIGRNLFVKEDAVARSRVITPLVENGDENTEKKEDEYEDFTPTSFIELANDETLLNIITMDIDGDGFDDQINIVKTSKGPYLD